MGHSQAEKADTHARIVERAARLLRRTGLDGIGLAELMRAAGLTHGGFYRHFASRDDLVGEAVEHAFDDSERRMDKVMRRGEAPPLMQLVDAYLSRRHRDDLETSCALSSLANDIARGSERTREAYARRAERVIGTIATLAGGEDAQARRRRAIVALSTMVGALVMARAVGDEDLSAEILDAAKRALKEPIG